MPATLLTRASHGRCMLNRIVERACSNLAITALSVCALATPFFAAHAQAAVVPDSLQTERAARVLLQRLAGDWLFEWRGDGRVFFTGKRSYRFLPDSLRLVWDETYDKPAQSGH